MSDEDKLRKMVYLLLEELNKEAFEVCSDEAAKWFKAKLRLQTEVNTVELVS